MRGQPTTLRPTEFRLLAFLCQNRDGVVAHQEILDRVWGRQTGSMDSLKWYVHSLRDQPATSQLVLTQRHRSFLYKVELRAPIKSLTLCAPCPLEKEREEKI